MLLCLVLDVAGIGGWSIFAQSAGANPLVAYFLHPIILDVVANTTLRSSLLAYKEASDPWMVVGGSAAMAIFVCTLAGLLGRLGLRMRL